MHMISKYELRVSDRSVHYLSSHIKEYVYMSNYFKDKAKWDMENQVSQIKGNAFFLHMMALYVSSEKWLQFIIYRQFFFFFNRNILINYEAIKI